jgi:glucokinase
MILAADIGGTKTNLALYRVEEERFVLHVKQQFSSQSYLKFSEIIESFLDSVGEIKIKSACFGIAGPVVEGRCKTTNLPWEIATQELQEQLNCENVYLLNDLEATAYGMLYLEENDILELNPNGVAKRGNCAVIAAGTGLGEAMLYFDGKRFHPIGCEGGHTDFAPQTKQQDALLGYLREKYPLHVSYERILSGPGIANIYDFLVQDGFAKEPQEMLQRDIATDKSALISKLALEQSEPLCVETLRLFVEIYGAEAGNMALKSFAIGGVYIGGGIAPKIIGFIKSETFLNAFVSKGRFTQMLASMPLYVSTNQETALLGALHFAKDKLV